MSRELRQELERLQARRFALSHGGASTNELEPSVLAELATLRARRRELEAARFQSPRPTPLPSAAQPTLMDSRAIGFGVALVSLGAALTGWSTFPMALPLAGLGAWCWLGAVLSPARGWWR
jgi:hypothetical protein